MAHITKENASEIGKLRKGKKNKKTVLYENWGIKDVPEKVEDLKQDTLMALKEGLQDPDKKLYAANITSKYLFTAKKDVTMNEGITITVRNYVDGEEISEYNTNSKQ